MITLKNQNSKVFDNIARLFKQSTNFIWGFFVERKIQPVAVINDKTFFANYEPQIAYADTFGTIMNVPTDKEFYLTSAHIGFLKAVTDSIPAAFITVDTDSGLEDQRVLTALGASTSIISNQSITFNPPIKLKKGSTIELTFDTGTNGYTRGGITGFYVPQLDTFT